MTAADRSGGEPDGAVLPSLDGATVVVLGGTSGMGLATARAAVLSGARVSVAGRDPDRLRAAEASLGGSVRGFRLDAADSVAVAAMFDELGPTDHVACFTGEQPAAPIAETGHDLMVRAMDARVWAARNACVAAAPTMRPGGSFTFCSGLSSVRPRAGRSAGALATAALESFGRAMAVELAPLRVNTICPGAFDTPVLERAFGEARHEALRPYVERLPMGRLGRPEEVAHAALFLMTNTYVTGTVLHVDGGALLL